MRPTLVASACTLLSLWTASAQSIPPAPTFVVASVKLNTSGAGNSRSNSSKGEWVVENSSLKNIIQGAYDVREYSFSVPDWLGTVRFDINAKLRPTEGVEATREQRQLARLVMMEN